MHKLWQYFLCIQPNYYCKAMLDNSNILEIPKCISILVSPDTYPYALALPRKAAPIIPASFPSFAITISVFLGEFLV